MNKLNVFYEEKLVGTLYRDSDLIYSFSYSDEWLKKKDAFQLSLAMPLQKESFGNKVTLSFFENLLPEGDARDALEKSQNGLGLYDLLKNLEKIVLARLSSVMTISLHLIEDSPWGLNKGKK